MTIEKTAGTAEDVTQDDPREHFSDPQEILDAPDMDRAEKLRLLEEWERDARLRQVADEENMEGSGAPGEELRQVRRALDRVRDL